MTDSINPVALETVRLLLSSASNQKTPGDLGTHTQFMFGPPHVPAGMFTLGAEVYFNSAGLLEATLHLRHSGPRFLRALSIADVEGGLTSFLRKSYWLISQFVFGQFSAKPFLALVPTSAIEAMAVELQQSQLFAPTAFVTVFPLVPVVAEIPFVSDSFFLVAPPQLTPALISSPGSTLAPNVFPPISHYDGRMEQVTSWLGVRAVSDRHAKRLRNAVLGAIALLPHHAERYFFSGRHMFGGQAAFFDGKVSYSYRRACTPALMTNLTIGVADHAWLTMLAEKLASDGDDDHRKRRALEYFYRAWPLAVEERVPLFFMALDAVFGNPEQHTEAVVASLKAHGLGQFNAARFTLLMRLRAAVIHGGAPDVYDSSHYLKYFATYRSDAVKDLERVVAQVLQRFIFQATQTSRPHTYAAQIKEKWGVEP